MTLHLANLTQEQEWALRELQALFSDPVQIAELDAWLHGKLGIAFDPNRRRLSFEVREDKTVKNN